MSFAFAAQVSDIQSLILLPYKSWRLGFNYYLINNTDLSPYNIIIVTCGHPFQDRASFDSVSMIIGMIGYLDPAMEGIRVYLARAPAEISK